MLVPIGDRLLIIGPALLAPAGCGALLLILDVVLGRRQALVGNSGVALVRLLTRSG